jgi:hypothetical protein
MVAALLLAAALGDELARHEKADQELYPMARVVAKLVEKLSAEGAEDYVEKRSLEAGRRALEATRRELEAGRPYREAFRRGVESLDEAGRRALSKDRDLKLLAGRRRRVLEFRQEYYHDERDAAKARQQRRAIMEVEALLWPR